MKQPRNRHDQQAYMYPCEVQEMSRTATLRTIETIPAMKKDDRVFRVDFLSDDPPRVFGASAILLRKDMSPAEFTDALRKMADRLDNFLHRENV